jgi:predicted RNA-binding Zn ribbon-like protein
MNMRPASQATGDWVDGFLFVGNRLILDLLNTNPVLADGPVELLSDTQALERWLIASGLAATPGVKRVLHRQRDSAEAKNFLKELVAFRERLRAAVLRMERGAPPTEEFIREVNTRLLQFPIHTSLRKDRGKIVREHLFAPRKPADLWGPIVDSAAELLAETDRSRIRKCESCVVHFFDTSKKGSRRWCSMNLCGNKVKVAAYQRRKRDLG